jgi:hypothetical protein
LIHPNLATDEDLARLVQAILEQDSIREVACEALVSHGTRASALICQLLRSRDPAIVESMLRAFDSNRHGWDESVVDQVEACLNFDDEDVRAVAMITNAMITARRDQYASYLCDLAAKEKRSMRFVCMTALSFMDPVPSSCKSKLEQLLVQNPKDRDFQETVRNRLSEIAEG